MDEKMGGKDIDHEDDDEEIEGVQGPAEDSGGYRITSPLLVRASTFFGVVLRTKHFALCPPISTTGWIACRVLGSSGPPS